MPRSVEVKRTARNAMSADEAQELFAAVDETGHTNKETARKQHNRRLEKGQSVEIDPLAGEDPSGADTDRIITRSAIGFVMVFLVLVMALQVGWGYVRRVTTSTLAEDASMYAVVSALNMGVEWGGGFTQFPQEFTVQEADENTHRIEVTVTDSSSSSELDAFSTAQVQASALSVNALLNPNIDTVIYHVRVRRDDEGRFMQARLFGFLRPTGAATPFMTFVWTKTSSEDGVRFDCAITGMDAVTQESLHKTITSKSTPATIINYVMGDNSSERAQKVLEATQSHDELVRDVATMKAEAEREKARRQVEETIARQVAQLQADGAEETAAATEADDVTEEPMAPTDESDSSEEQGN